MGDAYFVGWDGLKGLPDVIAILAVGDRADLSWLGSGRRYGAVIQLLENT
jgi:hypothetical protein